MINSYLKFTVRSLAKHRVYAGINLVGLAVGMAGAIVLFQLVKYHLSVDRYHANADRTYRVVVDLHLEDGSVEQERGSAYVLHETLKKEFSNVRDAAYVAQKEVTIRVDADGTSRKFLEKEHLVFTNADFFKIFDYKWISGNASAMAAPNQAVVTERYARKYFGNDNAMGKVIRANNRENLVIAGVVADYPEETDFQQDIFVSLPTLKKIVPQYGYEDWGWIDSGRDTYITLRSPEDKAAFEAQMPAFAQKYYGPDARVYHYHLQDLSDVHFNIAYGGKIKFNTIIVLATVGILLILIACFNFINLSTAQAFKRSKEVGVRKVLGVSQAQVFWLFIQETALLTFAAGAIALAVAWLFAPMVSQWLSLNVRIDIFRDIRLLAFCAALFLLVIMLAGVYPAFVISRFNPVKAIKGVLKENNRSFFSVRKGLVVTQFGISFVLIAVSTLIILQSQFLKNKDLGMDKDLILHLNLPETETSKLTALRNELSVLPEVTGLSFFRSAPSVQMSGGGSIRFENRDWEKFVARSRAADDQFVKTYGLKLVAGRVPVHSDTLNELLINRKLVRALGLKSPEAALNRRLHVGDAGKTGTIVGVLSDFNNGDLYTGIEPTIVFADQQRYRRAGVKLSRLNASTISRIGSAWQKHFPENVFEYSFYDEEIAKFYQREELATRLTTTFALLSVCLSCLGLFGLAIFAIEQRTKEIGVRKVLGASVAGITAMLSMDFLKLVLVAIVIASPVAWYFMHRWLQDFAYRIEIHWGIFAWAGFLAAGIALLTVSFQSIKAALTDPVKSLKRE
ncbi:putative ABC transport system permease protein [Dyadobacter soli]|uniref:Putative ABC transport system permease protein n=1 Tax=Dyadobacter soli TaxID=659014 RepID=A0A1G7HM73_9BACT|nr:ABC transporter permease [Dyadobacter soli]SDF01481.1 putative ABC transport system permease protein [Dyadobacter soli]